MQWKRPVVGMAGFVALFGVVVATAVPVGGQGVPGGPGCHLLMNQAACVACVKRNLPQVYDPQGSAQWCARQITERRAKGLGREPLHWDKGGAPTFTKGKCISMCLARGEGRTRSYCEPWCAPGCRNTPSGESYCVR